MSLHATGLSKATSSTSGWFGNGFLFFVAGVLTSAFLAAVIANFGSLQTRYEGVVARMLPGPKDEVLAKTEKKKEEENAEEPTENAVNEKATPKKPFEFRERLAHELPELAMRGMKCGTTCRKSSKTWEGTLPVNRR